MKKFFSTLSLTFLLGLSLMPAAAQTARVRVVHASSDAPAVDVLVDGNVAFQNLRFKDYTDYTPVPSGTRTFALNVAGTTTTALSLPFNLMAGQVYTFYAFGKLANSSLTIIGTGDELTPPAIGFTKVRIVHGASTAPPVDIFVTPPFVTLPSAPLLTAVPFIASSGYLTVPAADYQARVTPTGGRTVVIDSRRLTLTPRAVRTIVAVDGPTNGTFELIVLNDEN
ncbi:MAG: DUF4397 domain-containing protein [Acidobacteriota bacterium]|jgi:hypothetical protein